VLAAKNVIDTSFIVINADDYYGKEGFKEFFEKEVSENQLKSEYASKLYMFVYGSDFRILHCKNDYGKTD
jgi:hypothetical protein